MAIFLKALFLVVVAEMGDKTQLLAMAMASKYKAKHVLLGVLIATIFNHALAVLVGTYLNSIIPLEAVKLVAGFAFIVFGLWTIRGDAYEDDKQKKSKFGPILTVTIAFFFAEMGDKTQLMTIAIAADSIHPMLILAGTTCGMLVADSIGILGGAWMCKHVPDSYMKWIPGMIFLFFGTLTVYAAAPKAWLTPLPIIIYLIGLAALIYLIGIHFGRKAPVYEVIENDHVGHRLCPYHAVMPEEKCPYRVLTKDNQCKYNIVGGTEICPKYKEEALL